MNDDIPDETQSLLINLNKRFPPERREAFQQAIGSRLDSLGSTSTGKYALIGAVVGVVIDAIPGTGFITDDPVEVGAALGAWIGFSKDRKEKEERERISDLIRDSIAEAFAS